MQQASLEENQNLHYYASYFIVNINPLIRKSNQIGSGVANQQAITSFFITKGYNKIKPKTEGQAPKSKTEFSFHLTINI